MKLDHARDVLARANRMIAHEGVLDAFGHVTMRHPTDPGRYLMSRSRAPELVQPDDILEFTLDSQSVKPTDVRLYGERVIHGTIYHLGATLGEKVPFWDARDDFGDTTLIVAKPEEGASLARALGASWIVLMRRHGATVAGRTLEELTFRTIYTARNAALQIQAHTLGHVSPLNPAETELAGEYNLRPGPVARAWEYWNVRLDKAEGTWRPKRANPRPKKKSPPKRKTKRRRQG